MSVVLLCATTIQASYLPTQSSNVGIGTFAANDRLIVTGGNVGIGSVAPGKQLDVTGTVRATSFIGDGSGLTGLSGTGWTTSGNDVYKSSNGNVGIGTTLTTSSALTVMNGNVGIGTWVPGYPLELKGRLHSNSVISTTNSIVATRFGSVGYLATATYLDSFVGYNLLLQTQGGGSNVGIGSLTPGTALDVTGTVRATQFVGGGAGITGVTGTMSGLNTGYLSKASSATAINDSALFQSGNNIGIGTTTPQTALSILDGNVGIGTITADFGRLIVMNGNVGIGTVIPDNNLTVESSVNAAMGISIRNKTFSTASTSGIYFYNSGQFSGGLVAYPSTNSSSFYAATTLLNAASASSGGLLLGSTGGIVRFINGGASTEYARFSGTNLGLGTTVPMSRLTVLGGVGIGTSATTGQPYLSLQAPLGGLIVEKNVGIGTFDPYGGQLIISTAAGNVGIGSFAPGKQLDVTGTVRATAFSGDGSALTNVSNTAGFTDAGTEIYATTSTDNVGIGSIAPAAKVDITPASGQFAILAGADVTAITKTDSTRKFVRIGMPHYTNSEEPVSLITGDSDGTNNYVTIGGGTTTGNAATQINFKTSNTTTVTDGTQRMSITSTGNVGIGTITPQGGFVVTNGNVGIGTWTPGAALIVQNGNVGIGTIAAAYPLVLGNGTDGTYFSIGTSGTLLLGSTNGALGDISLSPSGSLNLGTSATDRIYVGRSDLAGYFITLNTLGGETMKLYDSNVGIGTSYMPSRLTIMGNVGIGTMGGAYVKTTAPANGLIVEGNVGIGTFNPFGGKLIIPTTGGNVGIGSLAPGTALDVTGTVRATAFSGDGSALTNVAGGGLTDDGTIVHLTTSTDNVGIGTTDASNGKLIVTGGNVGIGTTIAGGALAIMGGNVGIGTWLPRYALDVPGTTRYGTLSDSTSGLTITSVYTYTGGSTTGSLINLQGNSLTSGSGVNMTSSSNGFTGNMFGGTYSGTGSGNGVRVIVSNAAASGSPLFITNAGTGPTARFDDSTSDQTPFIIDSSGNLGIATTQPNAMLDISTVLAQDLFRINDNGTGDSTPLLVKSDGNVGIGTSDPFGGQLIISTAQGNVGIGSVVPGTTLDVTGTVRATAFSGDGSALTNVPGGGFTDDGTMVHLTTGTDNVGIGTVDASQGKLLVMNGNVGFGTTTPQGRLVVFEGNLGVGTIAPSYILETSASSTTYTTGLRLSNKSSTAGSGVGVDFGVGSTNTVRGRLAVIRTNRVLGGDTDMSFSVDSGGVSPLEMMRLISTGNLGIATANPGSRLSVLGGVGIGTVTAGQPYIQTAAPPGGLIVENNVGIGTWSPLALEHIVQAAAADAFRVDDVSGDTSPFVITSSGNVGIGTTVVDRKFIFNDAAAPTFGNRIVIEAPVGSIGNRTLSMYNQSNGVSADTGWVMQSMTTSTGVVTGKMAFNPSGGNVGIGTFFPIAAFNVLQTAAADSFKVEDVAGDTSPFVIDSNGSVGIGTTFTTTSGLSVMNGNVGIGTWIPQSKLDINGTASLGIVLLTPTSSVQSITAGAGLTTVGNSYIKIAGSGGAVVISNGVTQIAAGADGQELTLYGTSDTNTVKFHDGDGLKLTQGVSFTMGNNTILKLIYNSTSAVWREIDRASN